MSRSQFLEGLRKILEEDSLDEDQPIAPKTWDSVEIMSAIALIDKAGRQANVANILSCGTVRDLVDLACER